MHKLLKHLKRSYGTDRQVCFEFDNFSHGSRSVGEAIVEATKNGAFSLVGGGDSVVCVNKFGLADGVSYVSTGGGALLEAIEGKGSPGIAAIKRIISFCIFQAIFPTLQGKLPFLL